MLFRSYIVTKTTVGQPIGQFWGYKVIGRFDEPTDFYYKDADGNMDTSMTFVGEDFFIRRKSVSRITEEK